MAGSKKNVACKVEREEGQVVVHEPGKRLSFTDRAIIAYKGGVSWNDRVKEDLFTVPRSVNDSQG